MEAVVEPRAVTPDEHRWTDLEPGVRYTLLSVRPNGGVTTLTRFAAGTIGGWHTHPSGEELYVLEGVLDIAGQRLKAGDYLCTPPGGRHRVEALEDTLLLVSLPQLPAYE